MLRLRLAFTNRTYYTTEREKPPRWKLLKKFFTRAHIIWFLLLNFGLVLLAAGIHFLQITQ